MKMTDDEMRQLTLVIYLFYKARLVSRDQLRMILETLETENRPALLLAYLYDEVKKLSA